LCENALIRNSGVCEIGLHSGATSGLSHSIPASRNGQAIGNGLTEGRDDDQEQRDNQNNAPITSELTDTDRGPVAVSGDAGRPRGPCDNPPLGRKLDSDKHEHMQNLTDADRLTEQTCAIEDAENPTERDIRERPLSSISGKSCSTGGASELQQDGTDKTDPDKNAELTVRDSASSATLIDKPEMNKQSTEGATDEEALIVGEVLTRAKSRRRWYCQNGFTTDSELSGEETDNGTDSAIRYADDDVIETETIRGLNAIDTTDIGDNT